MLSLTLVNFERPACISVGSKQTPELAQGGEIASDSSVLWCVSFFSRISLRLMIIFFP